MFLFLPSFDSKLNRMGCQLQDLHIFISLTAALRSLQELTAVVDESHALQTKSFKEF